MGGFHRLFGPKDTSLPRFAGFFPRDGDVRIVELNSGIFEVQKYDSWCGIWWCQKQTHDLLEAQQTKNRLLKEQLNEEKGRWLNEIKRVVE